MPPDPFPELVEVPALLVAIAEVEPPPVLPGVVSTLPHPFAANAIAKSVAIELRPAFSLRLFIVTRTPFEGFDCTSFIEEHHATAMHRRRLLSEQRTARKYPVIASVADFGAHLLHSLDHFVNMKIFARANHRLFPFGFATALREA